MPWVFHFVSKYAECGVTLFGIRVNAHHMNERDKKDFVHKYGRPFVKFSEGLGKEIRRLRETKNMTLEMCEEKAEINWRQLQRIETGERPNWNLHNLFLICKALEIQPAELFKNIKLSVEK